MEGRSASGAWRWVLAGLVAGMVLLVLWQMKGPPSPGTSPPDPELELLDLTRGPINAPAVPGPGSSDAALASTKDEPADAGHDVSTASKPAASASATEEELVLVHGRVTSRVTGDPIAGATVMLHPFQFTFAAESALRVEATTQTDEQGHYRLHGSKSVTGRSLGECVVRAEAPGFETRGAYLIGKTTAGVRVDFLLGHGETVTGRVVNARREPIAGAVVGSLMIDNPGLDMLQGLPVLYSSIATTGDDGNFEIAGVPVDRALELPVRAEGYLPAFSPPVRGGDCDILIVLGDGEAKMHGRVLEPGGEPVPNATVVLLPKAALGGPNAPVYANRSIRRVTNAEGRYAFGCLAAEVHIANVVDTDGRIDDSTRTVSEEVALHHGEDLEKDFVFPADLIVSGRAYDADSDEGIAGVRVSQQPYMFYGLFTDGRRNTVAVREEAVTGSDGEYSVRAELYGDGNAAIYFEAPEGWVSDPYEVYGSRVFQHAPSATTHRLDLGFRRGNTVRGRVERADSTPAADAWVGCSAGREDTYQPKTQTYTDGDGAFSLTIPESGRAILEAKDESGYARREVHIPAGDVLEGVVLRLEAWAEIAGRVTNGRGEPLAGVGIRIAPRTGGAKSYLVAYAATTDSNGCYMAEKVAPGEIDVSAHPPETGGYSPSAPLRVTAEKGRRHENVDFVLSAGDAIEGVVSDGEGNPIAGATVYLVYRVERIMYFDGTTDRSGYYRIGGLPADVGIERMEAFHANYESDSRTKVSVFDGPQNFVLHRRKEIVVVAVDARSNEPVTRYECRLLQRVAGEFTPKMELPAKRIADAGGRGAFSSIASGEYRIEVAELTEENIFTGRRGAAEVTVERERAPGEVLVKVSGGRSITGRVVLEETGAPVEGALVAIAAPASPHVYESKSGLFDIPAVLSDAAGRFRLGSLPPGQYHLQVSKGFLQPRDRPVVTVELERDPDAIEVALVAAGVIFGRAIGIDGAPLAGAVVAHQDYQAPNRGWPPRNFSTNEEGHYRIEGATAGSHSLVLSHAGENLSMARPALLEAGQELEIDFDFSGLVDLSGALTENGAACSPGLAVQVLPRAMAEVKDRESLVPARLERPTDRTYRILLPPAEYVVQAVASGGIRCLADRFELAPEPRRQHRDIALQFADADIAVVAPREEDFRPGRLVLDQRLAGGVPELSNAIETASPSKRVRLAAFGEYQVAYTSNDGEWSGTSEWAALQPGSENTIVVTVQQGPAILLGRWTPEEMTGSEQTLALDGSGAITGPGRLQVVFLHERGACGLNLEGVVLRRDGAELSRDEHIGWTGVTNRNNIYVLEVPPAAPGGRYEIRARVRSDGGTDSSGSIFGRLVP